jgi:hypothetical protein
MAAFEECPCRGTNEYCCHCFGSGDLNANLQVPLAPQAPRTDADDSRHWGTSQARQPNSLLDGSYGFHQFREVGRFGSYCAHDPHHDESWP